METRDYFFVALFSKSFAHPEDVDFCSANKRPGAFIRKTPVVELFLKLQSPRVDGGFMEVTVENEGKK